MCFHKEISAKEQIRNEKIELQMTLQASSNNFSKTNNSHLILVGLENRKRRKNLHLILCHMLISIEAEKAFIILTINANINS